MRYSLLLQQSYAIPPRGGGFLHLGWFHHYARCCVSTQLSFTECRLTVSPSTAMPSRSGGPGHASHAFVWKEWSADIGYPNGFVFAAGMLNGAFSVGTPDTTT